MSVSRKIHFNALPESVRRRWVEITAGREGPRPLYAELLPSGIVSSGFVAVLGLVSIAFGCWVDFGWLGEPGAVQSTGWLVTYAGGGFMLFYGSLRLMRQIALRKALPFVRGRYLFALDLVEARGEVLELWPMSKCRRVSATHVRQYGILYRHSLIKFHFVGARRRTFAINGRNRAERVLRYLDECQCAVSDAATRLEQGQGREKDLPTLFALDPFLEARVSDQWDSLSQKAPAEPRGDAVVRPLPRYLAHVAPIALVASMVLGPATWYLRNLLSEQVMFDDARSEPGLQSLQQYLHLGGGRVAEARALLRQRELDEARGSAAALRALLAKYPDRQDVRQAIHVLYARAMAGFSEQASAANPRLVPFIDALLELLEKTENAEMVVSFSRPAAALLDELDQHLVRAVSCGTTVEPVAPHFSDATATRRERALVDRLQQGFGAVFPHGVVSLIHAESSPEEAGKDSRPSIQVAYVVAPSGTLYSDASHRAFLGIQVHFEVEMRVPGHPDVISFELDVQPSSEFVLESSHVAFAELPSSEPPSDLVYRVMVAGAFDQLSRKLASALFRADSEAFRRVAGTSQAAGAGAGTL